MIRKKFHRGEHRPREVADRLLAIRRVLREILRDLLLFLRDRRTREDRKINLVRNRARVGKAGEALHEIARPRLQRPQDKFIVPQKKRGAQRRVHIQFRLTRRIRERGGESLGEYLPRDRRATGSLLLSLRDPRLLARRAQK